MFIEKTKEWKWLITPSKSSLRSRRYAVVQRRDKSFSCDCKSFRYGTDECKHIQAVKALEADQEEQTTEININGQK